MPEEIIKACWLCETAAKVIAWFVGEEDEPEGVEGEETP